MECISSNFSVHNLLRVEDLDTFSSPNSKVQEHMQ